MRGICGRNFKIKKRKREKTVLLKHLNLLLGTNSSKS